MKGVFGQRHKEVRDYEGPQWQLPAHLVLFWSLQEPLAICPGLGLCSYHFKLPTTSLLFFNLN